MHTFLDQSKRRNFFLLSSGNNLPHSQRVSFLFKRKEIAFLCFIQSLKKSQNAQALARYTPKISLFLESVKVNQYGNTLVTKNQSSQLGRPVFSASAFGRASMKLHSQNKVNQTTNSIFTVDYHL